MARLKGFEPLTHALEGRCSILLSYRRRLLERVMGIGPTQPAWKAGTLPLSYTRIFLTLKKHTIISKICQPFIIHKRINFVKNDLPSPSIIANDDLSQRAAVPGFITVTPPKSFSTDEWV